jgi:hypothetical protein
MCAEEAEGLVPCRRGVFLTFNGEHCEFTAGHIVDIVNQPRVHLITSVTVLNRCPDKVYGAGRRAATKDD